MSGQIYSDQPPIDLEYGVELRSPKTQIELQASVMHTLATSRIWLNGYHCVRPSDEFLKDLGATVLTLANHQGNLLPSMNWMEKNPHAPLIQAQLDNPALYLKIIKS